MKILIISAPVGAGHIKAAQAVGAALKVNDLDSEIIYANVFDFFPACIGNAILKTYFRILSLFPQLYGMAYSWGNTSGVALLGRKVVSCFLAKQMHSYIIKNKPDAILCTHATPAGLVADLLRRGEIQVPAVAVVTDFVVHRLWIYPELTHYCVANEEVKQELADAGIPSEKISSFGIPVDLSFTKPKTAVFPHPEFEMPTIMIMGGGAGLLPMEGVIKELDCLNKRFQIIAVCGSNQKMRDRLLKMQPELRHRLRVYGFVDTIADLMAAADLLITKPGGLSSSEAMCSGLPLILYNPIPGQEAANAAKLIRYNVALQANTPEAVAGLANSLLSDPTRLGILSGNSIATAKPKAAIDIASLVIQLCKMN